MRSGHRKRICDRKRLSLSGCKRRSFSARRLIIKRLSKSVILGGALDKRPNSPGFDCLRERREQLRRDDPAYFGKNVADVASWNMSRLSYRLELLRQTPLSAVQRQTPGIYRILSPSFYTPDSMVAPPSILMLPEYPARLPSGAVDAFHDTIGAV